MASKFETINSLDIYEVNGTPDDSLSSKRQKLKVIEHHSRRDFVVIEVNSNRVTVSADDLKRAIENAQNAHKW